MEDLDKMLASMRKITAQNTMVSASLSARAMVLGKFFEASIPQLSTAQCIEIDMDFRRGIEDIMALMDDIQLPQTFHSELLSLTNTIIGDLKHRASTLRK